MAERDEWLARVATIKQWRRDGMRAPHKPLLILYALAQLQRQGASAVRFADAEPALKEVLAEFGPPATRPTPQYPFVRLANDGLWTVDTDDGSEPGENVGQLRASGATGRFVPELEEALLADPGLAALVAHTVLDAEWQDSLHDDICQRVGLDLTGLEVAAARERVVELGERRRRRDPAFRVVVLTAYEYRCAMCGYDGRIGTEAVALEAAHVRWWTHDGPDDVANGLCLCSLHHKLLDRGVLGVTAEHTVAVSRNFVGHSETARRHVLDLAGRELLDPQPGLPTPADEHIGWHTTQVFRAPARRSA